MIPILLLSVLLFVFFGIRSKFPSYIKVESIRMQTPLYGMSGRKAVKENAETKNLIALEALSRAAAYKNTSLKTNPTFFDDSDMLSEYYLVVVYDKKRNAPLLTARYYFDKDVIFKCLQGDENGSPALNPYLYKDKELFLSDRLSGNTSSKTYRLHRDYIFLLFYKEILRKNKSGKFILMARKEVREKLLTKYLRLGLDVAGSNIHKGKAHWILLGDLKKIKRGLKKTLIATFYLFVKT